MRDSLFICCAAKDEINAARKALEREIREAEEAREDAARAKIMAKQKATIAEFEAERGQRFNAVGGQWWHRRRGFDSILLLSHLEGFGNGGWKWTYAILEEDEDGEWFIDEDETTTLFTSGGGEGLWLWGEYEDKQIRGLCDFWLPKKSARSKVTRTVREMAGFEHFDDLNGWEGEKEILGLQEINA